MIRATILLTFSDGRSFQYANKYLKAKSGKDAVGNTILAGIPGTCYYYTGEAGDDYNLQDGKGKLKGDYEHLKGQIGTTGKNVMFPEKTTANDDTDELVRDLGENVNSGLTGDRFTFKAESLISVSISEKWIPFPGDDLDRESRGQLPEGKLSTRGFQESKETPSHDIYHKPMGDTFTRGNGFVPNPVLELDPQNNLIIKNKNVYDRTVETKSSVGYECYGEIDVKRRIETSDGSEKFEILKTNKSGISFIPFPVAVAKPVKKEPVKENKPAEVKMATPKPAVKSTAKPAPKSTAKPVEAKEEIKEEPTVLKEEPTVLKKNQ